MKKNIGYSGTPLAKKLGLKQGFTIKLVNEPGYYFDLFTDLPEDINIQSDPEMKKDFIHFFAKDIATLEKDLVSLKKEIKQNGIIWVSWSKKSSKITTGLTGNDVRNMALKTGLVDIKVCAVDDTWSGLKLVIPVKDRK